MCYVVHNIYCYSSYPFEQIQIGIKQVNAYERINLGIYFGVWNESWSLSIQHHQPSHQYFFSDSDNVTNQTKSAMQKFWSLFRKTPLYLPKYFEKHFCYGHAASWCVIEFRCDGIIFIVCVWLWLTNLLVKYFWRLFLWLRRPSQYEHSSEKSINDSRNAISLRWILICDLHAPEKAGEKPIQTSTFCSKSLTAKPQTLNFHKL